MSLMPVSQKRIVFELFGDRLFSLGFFSGSVPVGNSIAERLTSVVTYIIPHKAIEMELFAYLLLKEIA